jgi:hypothetical protein
MWAGGCLYAAVDVGIERSGSGLGMGAITAILIAVTGYYGSKKVFALISKLAISNGAKTLLKIALTTGYFPVAIPLAMLISRSTHLLFY